MLAKALLFSAFYLSCSVTNRLGCSADTGDLPGIEHKVSEEEAKAVAKTMTQELKVGSGCKNCSQSELAYCDSPDVISDHCCCDLRFYETFPYLPHTCFSDASHYCRTVVIHCEEFARLVSCCCHRFLATKWRNISNESGRTSLGFWRIICTLICMSLLVYTSN